MALNPIYRIFLTLPKLHLIHQNSILTKSFTVPFLKYKRLKLKLRVFLARHSVAMVTYCITKMTPTCSPVINSIIRKKFTMPFLKYKHPKLKLRVFLAGHTVVMVTYSVTKMITTCLPKIRQFFDTMIVASTDKDW